MVSSEKLGTLVQVDLRDVWKKEDTDFTPWLAKPEHITAVGNALNLELEVQAEEHPIGPFKADIYCLDLADGSPVLIENQLERTDHTHLGQLLTYAAGLDAVTIIWIAKKFTDEHRAALDWLNQRTDEKVNFFGLEIELWRIDGSPVAPKFNVVCRPNDWVRRVAGPARISENQHRLDQFWADMIDANENESQPMRFQKPNYNWMNLSIGRSNVHVTVLCRPTSGEVLVQLYMTHPGKELYRQLFSDRDGIEKQIGADVIWEEGPDQIASWLAISKSIDYDDETSRAEAVKWAMENTRLFERVFRKLVKVN
jgi:hypothetical protein